MTQKKARKARIIRASYELRARIGTGPVPENIIFACQNIIDQNEFDFSPLALELLENLSSTIRKTRARELSENDALTRMTNIVMQLKANASTFHYRLVGNLAQIMLGFLESLTHIDANAVEIVEAHQKTLMAIIEKRMTGDGGSYGEQLREELIHACERYERNSEKK